MRLIVMSDLHIDIQGNMWRDPPRVEADALIVIGDTTNPMTSGLHWIADNLCGGVQRCIYVPGNHDFYRGAGEEHTFYEDQMQRGREIARSIGFDLLQNDVLHLDAERVRFIGATLWTDYSVLPPGWSRRMAMYYSQNGRLPDGEPWAQRDRHNDYREIRLGAGNSRHRLTPSDTLRMHQESFNFFERTLKQSFEGISVCISHFGPASSVEAGAHSWLYGSTDIEALMNGPNAPQFWLHGHVHKSCDHVIGGTRVLCNPRGYPGPRGTRENPAFDPHLLLDIEPAMSPSKRI
ncbi:metallophosphoesterase family protein [Bradyrhizobium manausense]|uniref:metallophosphoesterase n=1 Tax=Bradyrhizobium manausense TaxID=989370 RepID=UPI001BA8A6C7|nr:metallophosphoesterase [Bradyrhizobium manausense]MBR0825589.1 metallophosphoesterase family protein [Bradyrhizobium manausense]